MKDLKKYKTVKEVLNKGHLVVTLVSMIILFGTMGLLVLFEEQIGKKLVLILFVFTFISAWLYWSFAIVKWRIWAFENTKKSDWEELKEEAISGNLIWHDGSIFEKTEIRTKAENQKIAEINKEIERLQVERYKKIEVEEQKKAKEELEKDFEDDLSIPKKTDYYFNRRDIMWILPILIFLFALCLYLILNDNIFLGLAGLGGIIYGRWNEIKNLKNINNKILQFSISDKGIFINMKNVNFVEWKDTEEIILHQDEDNQHLTLSVWKGEDKYDVVFSLVDFGIKDYDELLSVINIYMGRYYQKEENK